MMRVNQYSSSSMFQTMQTQRNVGAANNQNFTTSLQTNTQSMQEVPPQETQPQQIAGQQNSIQPTSPEGFSGFSSLEDRLPEDLAA